METTSNTPVLDVCIGGMLVGFAAFLTGAMWQADFLAKAGVTVMMLGLWATIFLMVLTEP